jgi:hypothetical protein
VIKKEDGRNDADIEEDWGEGWSKEMSKGIQDPHGKGEKSNEKKVWKHDLVERNGKSKLLWKLKKSRGNHAD